MNSPTDKQYDSLAMTMAGMTGDEEPKVAIGPQRTTHNIVDTADFRQRTRPRREQSPSTMVS